MIDIKSFNSLIELTDAFPTEEVCLKYLESLIWEDGVVSPFDPESKVYVCSNNRYICKNTGKSFNVKTGTIFENTKLPLRKWFMAIWLVLSHKKGISSLQLSRDIKVTQKTAWFMLQRIRECLMCKNEGRLENEVEADETFVGGKNKNRHKDKKVKKCQGRSFKDKTPVLGMVERKGEVVTRVIKSTSRSEITPIIQQFVDKRAVLYTDEWGGYDEIDKSYYHYTVDHGKGQYVNGRIYTNTIEGFWTGLKRGYIGIYHYMSPKHLQRYANEFTFRYNTRKVSDFHKFNLLLCNIKYRITKSRKTKSDGREKRKAIFEAKTKCAQKSRLLPPSGQNTSVVQTPFESCLNDAFLLNFLLKYHLKTHCQFSKKSYLYIVVMLPLCIPSRPHS